MRHRSLWRVFNYVRPYRVRMGLMLGAALAGTLLGAAVPLVTKAVIDGPLADGDKAALYPLAGLALVLGLVEAFLAWVRRYTLAEASTGIENEMRNDLYAHLQRLPMSFHDTVQSGQLLSRAINDINVIRRFVGFGLIFLIVNVVTFVVVVILLVQLDLVLAIITTLVLVPIGVVMARFESRYLVIARLVQDQQGDLTTSIEEGATGIRIIKSFGRSALVRRHFLARASTLRGSSLESVALRGQFEALLSILPRLALAAVLFGGALAVGRGDLSLGGLAAFISLLLMLVWPIEAMGWILAIGQEATAAADRVYEILDTEPEIADRPGARTLPVSRGRLAFEGAGFAYPGSSGPVLTGIDLTLEPGETVAVVGMTGSGKTTLVSLVPRLIDVTAGRVTLDGNDVRDLTLSSLRSHIGVAFEDPILFSASVRENLLLGQPDATDAEIAVALDTAQANFVYDLPWGIETRVGEQGLSLSGGQRQRLALARAVIGRPRVLVLDDPLSALDVHTEALVEEALHRVLAGTTALIVVHRPSTVALADRVAFLDGGTIVAIDTHSRLMATNATYASVLSEAVEEQAVEEQMA